MANKTLDTRQKPGFRIKPSQQGLKPRNPFAIAAKQRVAGPHQKTASTKRQVQKHALKKTVAELSENSAPPIKLLRK